jgi:uncharacterized membrane protein YccC
MPLVRFREQFARWSDRESLRPDLGRAIRATVALMAPLLVAIAGKLPFETTFAVIAAQSVAMMDVRGAYRLRFSLLVAASLILAVSAGLGGLFAAHLGPALVGMAIVAVIGGVCRHLSTDYGPSIAIGAALMSAIALAGGGGTAVAEHHFLASLAGGLWAVLLQVAFWPFRPEHPLRRSVGDSWLAVGDLFAALSPENAGPGRHARVAEAEAALRTALDQTYAALHAAGTGRPQPWVSRLEEVRRAAAELSLRVGAFGTALDALMADPGFEQLAPAFQTVLTALTNASRTVALAVVSRNPGNLATFEVRQRRLGHLLQVLKARLRDRAGAAPAAAEVAEILRQIDGYLPVVGASLRATIARADERTAISLELFDVDTWTLKPLASALNLRWKVDRALVRHTARITVLTMIGVAAFKLLRLPHGYWLPFTMVVVLQPDYGSTRQRAAQRMLGTVVGSVLASGLLALRLPFDVLMAATAAASFVFIYLVKRRYGVAVVFITLYVVLLTESGGPVTLAFTGERLGDTLAGGLLALVFALIFWPVWERGRFPGILARALRANGDYLKVLAAHLGDGRPYDHEVAMARRRAERANGDAFSSLQRMMGDPKARQERLEEAAALANGNQRLTRALSVVALHLEPEPAVSHGETVAFADRASAALGAIAAAIEGHGPTAERLEAMRQAIDQARAPDLPADEAGKRRRWIYSQLSRGTTELSAMLLAAEAFI